jgi:hypothetical protein
MYLGISLLDNVSPNRDGLDAVFPLLANVINILLFVAGAMTLIFILIGAFQYILSAGNPQNLSQAKRTLTFALVGLAIVILALVIVRFVRGIFA